MPSIAIVPMAERHVAALAKLERLCFSAPRSAQQLQNELDNPLARFFVAEYRDADGQMQVAGYGGMQNIAGECYVEDIAVFPSLRGQGIGRALTATLVETAKAEHCAFITLEVRQSNTVAIRLYQSLGFAEVGTRRDFYTQPTEDAVLMTCAF